LQIEPTTDDQPNAGRLGGFMGAHHSGKRVAIDDAERLDAEHCRRGEQFLRRRDTAQKREMRRDLKIGVIHASPMPCSHQPPPFSGGASRNNQNRVPSAVSTR
jgi:hypothetical protein